NGMSGGPVLSFSNKTNNYEAIGVIACYFPNKSTIHRSADEVVVKEYFAANNSGLAYIVLFNLKNAISSIRMVFYKNQGYIKFL
nr:hypothetical protein [Bacteroidia bacterium]